MLGGWASASDTGKALYTSTTAYCKPPGPIYVSTLALRFNRSSDTIDFDLSIASTKNDARLHVDMGIFVYGRKFVDMSVDLCSIASGALCPIPAYNFTGSGKVAIPDNIASKIPGIAFTVPDIEALALLRLTDTKTNEDAGCLQVSLANTMTVDLPAVAWGTGAFALAATVASMLTTIWTDSISALQWRVVDIITTMQMIPFTSMLTLIVPHVFHRFSLRLAWVVGLLRVGPVQQSIKSTRLATDSNDLDLMFGALSQAEYSRLSNFYPAAILNTNQTAKLGNLGLDFSALLGGNSSSLARRTLYAPNTGPGGEMAPGSQRSNVIWAVQMDRFSQTGAFYYTESLDISPYSALLTILVTWLWVVCVVLAVALLLVPVIWLTHRIHFSGALYRWYMQWLRPMLLRVMLIAAPPLVTLALFQFVHSTGWVSHFIAAVTCAFLLGVWLWKYAEMALSVRNQGPSALYMKKSSPWDSHSYAMRFGSLAHPYRRRFWWFGLVMGLCVFLRACFVAIPQKHDYALRQSIGLLVVDVLLFLVWVICHPGRDKKENMVQIVLCIFRIIAWALCIVLTTESNIWGIPRAVLGFVLMAVWAIAIVCLFLLFLWEIGTTLISRRQRWSHRYGESEKQHYHDDTSSTHSDASDSSSDSSSYDESSTSLLASNATHTTPGVRTAAPIRLVDPVV